MTSFLAIASACLFILVAATILYGDTSSSCPAPNTQLAASSSPSSSASAPKCKCYELPGADPVVRGITWLSPPQAVLALALLLAGGGGRSSRTTALAFVTLAVTAANHVFFARLAAIICVATSADAIGTFTAVAFGLYLFVAAVLLLLLLFMLGFLVGAGENAE
ncbi:hypothetical protein EJB05_03295 [Eragrostis curvula]|uniref:PGG domain-containing protein n=1 Tax=Eragrostis curvula TaxID=38414 RepID=A0A5J9W7E4_9POAL|nr:hypothetical protein EJB05_03295 [Eragrostis curvula]